MLAAIGKNMVLLLVVLTAVSVFADNVDEQLVRIRINADIESPEQTYGHNIVIVSSIGQGDVRSVDCEPYRMSLLVTDKRLDELSIELTIFDQTETARNSATVLASVDHKSSFDLSFGDVSISGNVWIEEFVQVENDKQ